MAVVVIFWSRSIVITSVRPRNRGKHRQRRQNNISCSTDTLIYSQSVSGVERRSTNVTTTTTSYTASRRIHGAFMSTLHPLFVGGSPLSATQLFQLSMAPLAPVIIFRSPARPTTSSPLRQPAVWLALRPQINTRPFKRC